MEQHLSSHELAFYRATDEVLHYIWDPIGVAGMPQARDEYYGYLPQVFSLLQSGADEQSIADVLGVISIERMGLTPNPQRDLTVAQVLLAWKAVA